MPIEVYDELTSGCREVSEFLIRERVRYVVRFCQMQ